MKIRSITDVITNSSTEVFLLNTTKSLEEVTQFLSNHEKGCLPSEILEKERGILRELYDSGELYNTRLSKEYMCRILERKYWDIYGGIPDDLKEIRKLWREKGSSADNLDEFLEEVWRKPIPNSLRVPEELTLDFWIGKIGFCGIDENSVPPETFKAVQNEFNTVIFRVAE